MSDSEIPIFSGVFVPALELPPPLPPPLHADRASAPTMIPAATPRRVRRPLLIRSCIIAPLRGTTLIGAALRAGALTAPLQSFASQSHWKRSVSIRFSARRTRMGTRLTRQASDTSRRIRAVGSRRLSEGRARRDRDEACLT